MSCVFALASLNDKGWGSGLLNRRILKILEYGLAGVSSFDEVHYSEKHKF